MIYRRSWYWKPGRHSNRKPSRSARRQPVEQDAQYNEAAQYEQTRGQRNVVQEQTMERPDNILDALDEPMDQDDVMQRSMMSNSVALK